MASSLIISQEELAAICGQFRIGGRIASIVPYGTGHINDTYSVICAPASAPRYILQRVNHLIFRDVPRLMENVERVTAHVGRKVAGLRGRQALTLVPLREGGTWHQDPQGNFWRVYVFVEGASTHDQLQSPRQAFEAARAFGEFQTMLCDLPGPRLHDTIPNFHHSRERFNALERAIKADAAGRVRECGPEIAAARERESLVDVLLTLQARGEVPERVTHNDTKINNVMLDDDTGQGVCVIDLDTVMPGLALYDFGDMVRTAANSAAEDETDLARVRVDLPVFEALVRGYLSSAGAMLTAAEIAHLVTSARLLTFECAIRFLADHLAGDVYFKIHRPGHNLDRYRCQLALLRSMEQAAGEMEQTVRLHSPR